MSYDIPSLLLAFVLGGGIGFLSGCFGAGGGFLLTPALNILLGLPMNLAVGTSALQVTGASALSLWRHGFSRKMFGTRLALVVGSGILVGSFLGARLVAGLKADGPDTVDSVLMGVYVVFLLLVGGWLVYDNFLRPSAPGRKGGLLRNWHIPPIARFRCLRCKRFSIPLLVALGIGVGVLSGLLGIGGGVVLLPMLVYLVGVDAAMAARISSMLVLLSGVFSSLFHGLAGNINYALAGILLAGALAGTSFGVRLQKRLPHKALLGYFGAVVLLAWVVVGWRFMDLKGWL